MADSITECLLSVLEYLDENSELLYGKEGDPLRRETMALYKQVSQCLEDHDMDAYLEYLGSTEQKAGE